MNYIPTGYPILETVFGVPGYPRGRITELLGPARVGKTTLALRAAAACQQHDGLVSIIDVRHAFDTHYASALGVDTASLLVHQPEDAAAALKLAQTLVRTGTIDLLLLDSITAPVGVHPPEMKKTIRSLTSDSDLAGTCVILTTRNTAYGNRTLTQYYAALRVRMTPTSEGRTQVKTIKNRLAPPFMSTELNLNFGRK